MEIKLELWVVVAIGLVPMFLSYLYMSYRLDKLRRAFTKFKIAHEDFKKSGIIKHPIPINPRKEGYYDEHVKNPRGEK